VDVPDTVTAAVQFLQSEGYRSDFVIDERLVCCGACGREHSAPHLKIRHTFRFEGASDPGDEAIVLGLECPSCGAKGIIVSAYGPDADTQFIAVLDHLDQS
jgi:hypothetical protein